MYCQKYVEFMKLKLTGKTEKQLKADAVISWNKLDAKEKERWNSTAARKRAGNFYLVVPVLKR